MTAEQDRLRREIEKRYKAVSNKINRTRRRTGAEVSGSEFDPRRDPNAHNRMRSPERMRQYLGELNNFMRRNNQFVAGDNGAPLPRHMFNTYKGGESQLKALQDKRDQAFGDIQTPAGWKVRDQEIAMPKAGGHGKYGPYGRFDREAADISNANALRKLIDENRRQLNPNYVGSELDEGRRRLNVVLDYLGESQDDLRDAIDEMDDFEFDLFWFGFKGASGIFLFYELEKERQDATRKEKRQDRVIESKFQEVRPSIERVMEEGKKHREQVAEEVRAKREAEVARNQANLRKKK